MIKIITMKYDSHSSVREHIMKVSDMTSQFKGIDMKFFEGFLIQFIIISLPPQFIHFKINYNIEKHKWKMNKLISMCIQEEGRLKVEKHDMAHLTIVSSSKKSFKTSKGKKRSKVMMNLIMGKMMKIIYNVIFATTKVTKEEIVLVLRLGWKRRVKLNA